VPVSPNELGFVCFAAVKLAGYTAAAWCLRRDYRKPESNIWKIGAARTALGIAVGVSYGTAYFFMAKWFHLTQSSVWIFWVLLVPIRLGEWSLVLWGFFERGSPGPSQLLRNTVLGTIWSFFLDFFGMLAALVVPGNAWIC
jgi:hypothetical protein